MKIFATIILALVVHLSFAQQTIKKSSIDSGGEVAVNGNISMVFTVGEVVVQESINGNILVSEGFINPNFFYDIKVGVGEYEELEGVTVFPNPTVRFVNVEFVQNRIVDVVVYNENGKVLIQETGDRFKLDLSAVATGLYFLVIKDNVHNKFKSFKIVKR